MLSNRELSIDDYLAILRRRWTVVAIPALLAPIIGFGISFFFSPKYTSQSLVLVEGQKVAQGYVQPVGTEDIAAHVERLQEKVLSRNRLAPVIERLGLAKREGSNVDDLIDKIRTNLSIQAVQPDLTSVTSSGKSGTYSPQHNRSDPGLAGFYVSYTDSNAHSAQRMCTEMTSLLLEENLKDSEQVIQNTTDFLSQQIDEARQALDEQGKKLSVFKGKYLGQLPGDQEANLKTLKDLNSQLDANTQTLSRAQQDRAFAESLLAQKLGAWKASQGVGTDPQALEQQISQLEDQLVILKAKYTDDHPDVVKTRNDIAELKQKLAQTQTAKKPNTTPDTDASGTAAEPPEIAALRSQLHQYDNVIAESSHEEKHLRDEINIYESEVQLSPELEQEYNGLTRDYEGAQKFYDDLLAKRSESGMQSDMARREEGEQMRLLNPASLPDSPSFPVRWEFAAGGLGAGLGLGVGIVLWLEMRDKAIRTEEDVHAALDLPTLICVPWVGPEADLALTPYGYPRKNSVAKETVEV